MNLLRLGNTLDLDAAQREFWDILVLGAGPAGSLAARQLALAGARVLLIDKKAFPRPKVCGACLNGQAIAVLRSCGLESTVRQSGAVAPEALQVQFRGRSARFPLPDGLVLSRVRLDYELVEAALEAGAELLQEARGEVGPCRDESRDTVLTQGGRTGLVRAKLVLNATGLGNTDLNAAPSLRTWVAPHARIGAGTMVDECPKAYRSPWIFMAVAREGYVGLVATEDGRLNVAAAFDKELIKRSGGPNGAAATVLAEAGATPIPALALASWSGTPSLTRQTRPVAAERLFLLGDATGYVEPFTGEGMAWALASAEAIIPLALRGIERWQPSLAEEWSRLHHRLVARRQEVCQGLALVLRHPWLSRAVFSAAIRAPVTARFLLRRVNAPPLPAGTRAV